MWRVLSFESPVHSLVAHRVLGEVLEPSAGDVAAGVARQRVEPEPDHVDQQEERAQPQPERRLAGGQVGALEREHHVVGVEDRDRERDVEEVAVQRSAGSAGTASHRSTSRAARRPRTPAATTRTPGSTTSGSSSRSAGSRAGTAATRARRAGTTASRRTTGPRWLASGTHEAITQASRTARGSGTPRT